VLIFSLVVALLASLSAVSYPSRKTLVVSIGKVVSCLLHLK